MLLYFCVTPGWLSANCTRGGPSNVTTGFFSYGAHSIEFCTDSTTVYVKLSIRSTTFFGIIFNPSTDGMSPTDGIGDAWVVGFNGAAPAVSDRHSTGRITPSAIENQDLSLHVGWANSTHEVIDFSRLLHTGDSNDLPFVKGTDESR